MKGILGAHSTGRRSLPLRGGNVIHSFHCLARLIRVSGGLLGLGPLLVFNLGSAGSESVPKPERLSSPVKIQAPVQNPSARFTLSDPELPARTPGETNRVSPLLKTARTNAAQSIVSSLEVIGEDLTSANLLELPKAFPLPLDGGQDYQQRLETARQMRRARSFASANRILVTLLEDELPAEYKRAALLELALVAQDERKLPRAQQILSQYHQLFPQDPTVPEVLLRQGLLYRELGANQLAIAKYYAVMSTALNLNLNQFDYYKRLVLQAQTEIADTYYLQGKAAEAADFFQRLIKQNSPDLHIGLIRYKLIRCLAQIGRHSEAVAHAEVFLEKHSEMPEVPEVRFLLASALKAMGRNGDAMKQVLKLLASQSEMASASPEIWTYWKLKAGNQIANDFYRDGDDLNALEVYLHLAELNTSLAWQLPVLYQIGLVYEHLQQPQKAIESYDTVAAREKEMIGASATEALKALVGMAKWRKEHLIWLDKAIVTSQTFKGLPSEFSPTKTPSGSVP